MLHAKKQSAPNKVAVDRLWKAIDLTFVQPVIELAEGFATGRLPIYHCMAFALFFEFSHIFKFDYFLLNLINLDSLYPAGNLTLLYRTLLVASPFWAWCILQVALRFKLVRQLTEIFTNAGLKSLTGKLPGFITDKALDKFTRKMRLSKCGQSLQKFETAKDDLESGLQVFIDEISEDRKSGTIDIIYSHAQLDDLFELKDVSGIYKNSFLIGKGRSKLMYGGLEDTPHLLVAGQTGMGKSTFLRQLITSLYLNNKNYSFDLIDLKGGLEFQIFDNLPRVLVKTNVESSIGVLKQLAEDVIKERTELLKLNSCKDISTFLKLDSKDRKYPAKDSLKKIKLDRHIVVIDEAFDLFMVGPHANSKDVKDSRRHSSKIAAQGRAVGVHLIIATQRPDRFAIDPQTKANLTGKVCFRLPNLASSMTVMDNKRAAELPNIKGRAIWQNSSEQFEVQTPFYTEDQATSALADFYNKNDSCLEEQNLLQNLKKESEHDL